MFDIGWQEFILVALVAVVVVGPKDLPRVIRTVGQWVRKARSLASEFQGSLEEMAREAELDDVRKSIQQVSREGIGASIEKHVDPDGEIRRSVEEARDSSGADEIEGAIEEARRDTRALAGSDGSAAGSYEAAAARNPIPDNSVTPPAEAPKPAAAAPAKTQPAKTQPAPTEPAATKPAATKPAARKAAAKTDGDARPAKSPVRRTAAKASDAAAKPAAKPRRTTRKPAATDAGEA
jgi:sec-independent protein translocase protein TatB